MSVSPERDDGHVDRNDGAHPPAVRWKIDWSLAAEAVCTDEEKEHFLSAFPGQRGAHVADLLSMMSDSDFRLDILEPMAEEAGEWWGPEHGYACYLLLYARDVAAPTWAEVDALAARLRAAL
jgi:hypothetical protein